LCLYTPFDGDDDNDILRKVMRGDIATFITTSPFFSEAHTLSHSHISVVHTLNFSLSFLLYIHVCVNKKASSLSQMKNGQRSAKTPRTSSRN
jgi:hypothetical protein